MKGVGAYTFSLDIFPHAQNNGQWEDREATFNPGSGSRASGNPSGGLSGGMQEGRPSGQACSRTCPFKKAGGEEDGCSRIAQPEVRACLLR